jgi:hypothetical protein
VQRGGVAPECGIAQASGVLAAIWGRGQNISRDSDSRREGLAQLLAAVHGSVVLGRLGRIFCGDGWGNTWRQLYPGPVFRRKKPTNACRRYGDRGLSFCRKRSAPTVYTDQQAKKGRMHATGDSGCPKEGAVALKSHGAPSTLDPQHFIL